MLGLGEKPAAAPDFLPPATDISCGTQPEVGTKEALWQQVCATPLQPEVLDKYPFFDYEDGNTAELEGLIPCAFPLGCKLAGAGGSAQDPLQCMPTFFSFRANTMDIYGHVFVFWEDVPKALAEHVVGLVRAKGGGQAQPGGGEVEEEGPPPEADTTPPAGVQAPKAFMLLSRWNFPAFKRVLRELYRLSLSPQPVPMEALITNLCCEVVLPPCGMVDVAYVIGSEEVTFSRPPVNQRISPDGLHLWQVAEVLPSTTWATAVQAMLLERPIILESASLNLLMWAAEALVACMYPFKWPAEYMPVMPAGALAYLQAPFPYLAGVHASLWPGVDEESLPIGVVVVHLDSGAIDVAEDAPLPPLPAHHGAKLLRELQSTVDVIRAARRPSWSTEVLPVYDAAFAMVPPRDVEGDEEAAAVSAAASVREEHIRTAFFKFHVALLMEYRRFMPPDDGSSTPRGAAESFDRDGFLHSLPSDCQPFMQALLRSQAWSVFEQNRAHPDRTAAVDSCFLDESIAAKANRYTLAKWRGMQRDTPFLDATHFAVQRSVGAMRPDASGVAKGTTLSYAPFPLLNPHAFPAPRQVNSLSDDVVGLTAALDAFVSKSAAANCLNDAIMHLAEESRAVIHNQLETTLRRMGVDSGSPEVSRRATVSGKPDARAGGSKSSSKRRTSVWAAMGSMFGNKPAAAPDTPAANTSLHGVRSAGMLRPVRGRTASSGQQDARSVGLAISAARGHVNLEMKQVVDALDSTVYTVWFVTYAAAVRAGVGAGLARVLTGSEAGVQAPADAPSASSTPGAPAPISTPTGTDAVAAARADAAATLHIALKVLASVVAKKAASKHFPVDPIVYKSALDIAGRCGSLQQALGIVDHMTKAGLAVTDVERAAVRRAADLDPHAASAVATATVQPLVGDILTAVKTKSMGIAPLPMSPGASAPHQPAPATAAAGAPAPAPAFVGAELVTAEGAAAISTAVHSPYGLLALAFPDLSILTDEDTCPQGHPLTYSVIATGWQADRNQYTTVCSRCISEAWDALIRDPASVTVPQRFVPHMAVSCSAPWWQEHRVSSQSASGARAASATDAHDDVYWCYLLPPWALLKEVLAVLQPGKVVAGSAGPHPFIQLRQKKPMLYWNMVQLFNHYNLPCDFLVAASACDRDGVGLPAAEPAPAATPTRQSSVTVPKPTASPEADPVAVDAAAGVKAPPGPPQGDRRAPPPAPSAPAVSMDRVQSLLGAGQGASAASRRMSGLHLPSQQRLTSLKDPVAVFTSPTARRLVMSSQVTGTGPAPTG